LLHYFYDGAFVAVAGHNNEWEVPALISQAFNQVGRWHVAEFQVKEEEICRLPAQPIEGSSTVFETCHVVSFASEGIDHQEK
jgi:hypothetical protein